MKMALAGFVGGVICAAYVALAIELARLERRAELREARRKGLTP